MSSAQVIRDCQEFFNPSSLFAPMIAQEKSLRERESKFQKNRRKHFKRQIRVKMGHGGTLDPLASGVLILGVGKGTKSLHDFLNCTKTYEAVVLFGASTDTYDRVGRIIKRGQYDEVTRPAVERALEGFRGKLKQMPPLYSALKMEGKPLYEYAREGKPIPREIETREVEVTELELVEWYEPGTHTHRWPAEEAEQAEKNLVDSVWRVAKRQVASEEGVDKLTPEQQEEETKALAEYQSTKREAEERVDSLVREEQHSTKRRKVEPKPKDPPPMMSGALGKLPPSGKGSNLIPPPPSADAPLPWDGKGPPACKIRMTVTSGFYVRSLCHDLGEKLGSGAMMAELVRSRQGDFVLGSPSCLEYPDLLKGEKVWGPKVEAMLSAWTDRASSSSENSTHASEAVPVGDKSSTMPELKADSQDVDGALQPEQAAELPESTEKTTSDAPAEEATEEASGEAGAKLPEEAVPQAG